MSCVVEEVSNAHGTDEGGTLAAGGDARDLGDNVRVQVQEMKISDGLLPWSEALQEAQRLFPGESSRTMASPASTERPASPSTRRSVKSLGAEYFYA